jgi:tetratricopeptide (TPR) repeat protein
VFSPTGNSRYRVLLIVTTFLVAIPESVPRCDGAEDSAARSDQHSQSQAFDPVGKSYGDLLLEGKRAFTAGEYDRVIQLMNYALTLEITRQQAAETTLNRGLAYWLEDDVDLAMKDFDTALKLNPRLAPAYHARGMALMKKNDLDDAQRDLQEAINLSPSWQFYESAAQVFEAKHEWTEALKNIARAIELDPKAPRPYASRAFVELRYGQYDKVIADAGRAISLDRNTTVAYIVRANAFIRLKRYQDADKDLQSAVNADIMRPAVKFNDIAWLRATCLDEKMRNGKIAVQFGTKACDLTKWKEARYIDTLAAAYAETGDFESAVKWQQQALQMLDAAPLPNMPELRARLALYQQHQPYRDQIKP